DHILFGLLDTDPKIAPVPLEQDSIRASRRARRRSRFTTVPAQRAES
ncbi:uncharacterized protein METZ01_LOCUS240528, partial [marine metagenome]